MSLNENEYESGHLEELKGSDYEIADGQPDIIGWAVEDVSGKNLGKWIIFFLARKIVK